MMLSVNFKLFHWKFSYLNAFQFSSATFKAFSHVPPTPSENPGKDLACYCLICKKNTELLEMSHIFID